MFDGAEELASEMGVSRVIASATTAVLPPRPFDG
jgi:hypothetical protein